MITFRNSNEENVYDYQTKQTQHKFADKLFKNKTNPLSLLLEMKMADFSFSSSLAHLFLFLLHEFCHYFTGFHGRYSSSHRR